MSAVLAAAVTSLVASLLAERLVEPPVRPWRRRPVPAAAVHAGIWLLAFALVAALLQRPWLAATVLLALELVLVQSNRAKWHTLHEPFVHQDLGYFLDALRHPRLYVPFFGLGLAGAAAAAGGIAIAAFLYYEPALGASGAWPQAMAALAGIGGLGALLLGLASPRLPEPHLDPAADLAGTGLLAHLWRYGRRARRVPPPADRDSPFRPPSGQPAPIPGQARLPHVVAVQSESFFDARRWSSTVAPDVLASWDALCRDGLAYGPLTVPAWGANTVRTEAAFLTGLDAGALDIHRFNPYAALARQPVASLASRLRGLGYRTVAVHPYPGSFYARSSVLARLGFDDFLDGSHFRGAERCGPYVGDAAVAERVVSLLEGADDAAPLFIFVITMENHGPLHLERAQRGAPARGTLRGAYGPQLPADGGDLAVYLGHLRNADRMIARLRAALTGADRPGVLCWYGDHVPIMADTYQALGYPDGRTDYAVWATSEGAWQEAGVPRRAEALGLDLYRWILARAATEEAAAARAPRSATREA